MSVESLTVPRSLHDFNEVDGWLYDADLALECHFDSEKSVTTQGVLVPASPARYELSSEHSQCTL